MSLKDAIKETIEKVESDPSDLPERDKEESIEINQVATTDDGYNFPCYKIEKGGSWMDLCHNTSEDKLYISHVWMSYKGDFKQLMDFLVEELGTNQIKFTMVINDNLQKALNGFEEKTEFHEGLNHEMTVLEGEWQK